MSMPLVLDTFPTILAICRLDPNTAVPAWANASRFVSITRTTHELSIVCPQAAIPVGALPSGGRCDRDWRFMKVRGSLDFGLVGVLASITKPLAEAGISLFSISTFDTDYILIKESNFAQAITCLRKAGHEVVGD